MLKLNVSYGDVKSFLVLKLKRRDINEEASLGKKIMCKYCNYGLNESHNTSNYRSIWKDN